MGEVKIPRLLDLLRGTAAIKKIVAGEIDFEIEGTGFRFRVPVDDLSGTTIMARERASVLMRWIRLQHDNMTTCNHRCETCDSETAIFAPDPYQAGDDPIWMCVKCRSTSSDGV